MTSHTSVTSVSSTDQMGDDDMVVISGPPCADSTGFDENSICALGLEEDSNESSSVRSLRDIADKMAEVVRLDDEDDEDFTSDSFDEPIKISIQDLFDFKSAYWTNIMSQSSICNLDDEMELHELLDLDADGDFDKELADITCASL
ncbi:hypothetical protein BDQ17DRAFT_1434524 [Cyathus striatus]|nr:hypothetical protein BDQ17DRAFT_1434630 [Cyathus striatus]KAF8989340.1 hypothetical protein BDQ17DRAFT_1434524 [Cyathus striatus]